MSEAFGLEAALLAIESGTYSDKDVKTVAKRCRDRGSKMALWCNELREARQRIKSLEQDVSYWKLQAEFARRVCKDFVADFDRSESSSFEPTVELIELARFHARSIVTGL